MGAAAIAATLALAATLGVFLARRWAEARAELTRRVAELTTIEEVGQRIAQAQLDQEELCELLYEHAGRVADTTIFHLGLFDGDEYRIALWMREGHRQPQQSFRLSPGVGLVNWLRESRQPILIRDFEKELESLPARPVYVSDRPPRSAIFTPLCAGETVIGTLSLQSYQPHAYAESELRVLSAMANQAAVALQKAELYSREQKRARQLETIGQVSRQVAATLELEELFRQTVQLVRENFGYYHVGIFTANRERRSVTFQASASAGQQDVAFEVSWGEGLIGWVAANAQAVIINDVENEPRYRCIEALDETQSEVAVPLQIDGEMVGVLDVQSDRVRAFGPDDLFILETLGDQVAIAIQEARLYEAERQQAWLATALLQVAEATGRLSDMDDVLTTVVRLTPLLAGVDRCAILLWDEETEAFLPAQTHGLGAELRDAFERMTFPAGRFPALDLLRAGKSPVQARADLEGRLIPVDLSQMFNIEEMILLPLLAQGELLGVMMVDYAGRAHSFSAQLTEMLTGISNQAAMVIQSARLLRAQTEEAYVSAALLEVARAVSQSDPGSTGALKDALAAVARITPMLIGVDACAFHLWDADAAALVPVCQYGLPKESVQRFWESRYPASVLAADLGELSRAELLQGAQSPADFRESMPTAEGPLLALPVMVRGEPAGMMSVIATPTALRSRERLISILSGIASQAAIAVENHRLLQEAAEQERMKQELAVARRIQSSFLPDTCPDIPGWEVSAIWRSAREVAGDFYDFVPIRTSRGERAEMIPPGPTQEAADKETERGIRTGVVIADVADKGVPAALFMALARTLVRTMAATGRRPSAAIGQANDLILADTRSELFVTLFYAIVRSDTGEVVYVNAGHLPPLLVRARPGHADDGTVEALLTGGMAMGVLPGLEYEERTAWLEPGDLMVMYTDGVVEASNPEGDLFGRDRLAAVAREHRTRPTEDLVELIEAAVAEFTGDVPRSDDLTLVVLRRAYPNRGRFETHPDPPPPPQAGGPAAQAGLPERGRV